MSLGIAYMASHARHFMPLSKWPGDLTSESGVYVLRIHEKIYVGQTKNLKQRIRSYRYVSKKTDRPILRAIAKYGVENCFVVAEMCPVSYLDERETFLIRDLMSLTKQGGYNIVDGPSGMIGKKLDDETINKMCKNHADVRGNKNPFWGKHHTAKTRLMMRKSKPAIASWNVQLKGRPVVKVDVNTGELVAEFPSSRKAAIAEGIRCTSMSARCNKKRPSRNGYCWRWKDDGGEDANWAKEHV